MKTGEGKHWLTLPAYLNALTVRVHIVTVNDYLAKRDSQWMGEYISFRSYCRAYSAWLILMIGKGHIIAM